MAPRRAFAALLCLLLASTNAFAWGDDGHRITGHLANSLLNANARAQLIALVGTDDLAQLATWMDDERDPLATRLPGSARWHYENRAACGTTSRSCIGGHCITAQIDKHRQVLQDQRSSRQQRADAIRVLVHLLGDLHQPLHLSDNQDRGGNDVLVLLPGQRDARRLHKVWDTSFVRANLRRRKVADYAHDLANRFAVERVRWQNGNIEVWATETYILGKEHAYQSLPNFVCGVRKQSQSNALKLSADYVAQAQNIVDAQLAKAGVRIAWVLNSALHAAEPSSQNR